MLRKVIGIVAFLAVFGIAVPAHHALAADKFPSKTITWLIPYAPAGGFDLHSRALSIGMKKALGVNVILRNRPGAGGNIAWNLTWSAKPDGYTIATVNIPGAIVSELFGNPKPAYKLRKFAWLGQISAGPYVWAVGTKTPFHSLKDMQAAKEVLLTGTGVGATGWVTNFLERQRHEVQCQVYSGLSRGAGGQHGYRPRGRPRAGTRPGLPGSDAVCRGR